MNVEEHILFYAFRYTLGRRTYAVSQVANEIIKHKDQLSDNTRKLIVKEIDAQKEKTPYGLGDQCDVEAWLAVRKVLS